MKTFIVILVVAVAVQSYAAHHAKHSKHTKAEESEGEGVDEPQGPVGQGPEDPSAFFGPQEPQNQDGWPNPGSIFGFNIPDIFTGGSSNDGIESHSDSGKHHSKSHRKGHKQ